MSIPPATDLALLDISCRILALSSSLEQATGLIHRIQALSIPRASDTSASAPSPISTSPSPVPAPDASPLGETVKIPWTITNRYYSADVHFAARAMHGLGAHLLRGVPAVIFVWAQGEAYKHHVRRLAKDLEGYEAEVALAVRVSADAPPEDAEDEAEDNADIDDFMSANGFEYIDATRPPPARGGEEEEEEFGDGIPHLPRVLDALSTIMWPSMTSSRDKSKGKFKTGPLEDERIRKLGQRIERDPVIMMLENMDDSDEPPTREAASQVRGGKNKADGSLHPIGDYSGEEIFKPFEEARFDVAPSASPFGSLRRGAGALPGGGDALAFDDDFTGFVSAPPVHGQPSKGEGPGRASPGSDRSGDTATRSHADHVYRSLGSASEFQFVDDGEEGSSSERGGFEQMRGDEDENEEDLPSKAEIEAVSARIFEGSFVPSGSPGSGTKGGGKDFSFDEIADLMDAGDGSYDMTQFDLSKVLTALQHMKAEIAGMENEDERRRAAAKVALGLVYGLEAEAGAEE